MRLRRALPLIALPLALAGCLNPKARESWYRPAPLLKPVADGDSALIQYVLIERNAGTEEINRRAWDRVDEQVLSFETRTILETAGLRVGIADESAAGPLRKLIDEPRTPGGLRMRSVALDRPAPLGLTNPVPSPRFTVPIERGQTITFAKPEAVLGFEMTLRPTAEGKTLVRLVPRARYPDASQLLTADIADRGTSTDTFPAAAIELTLSATEYLVVGTEDHWSGTFGHTALTDEVDGRPVQRLLVIRAARPSATRPDPLEGDSTDASVPLATRATLRE